MTENTNNLAEVTSKLKKRGGRRRNTTQPLNVADLDIEKLGPDARRQIEAAMSESQKAPGDKNDEILAVDTPNKRVKRVKARDLIKKINVQQKLDTNKAISSNFISRVKKIGRAHV